MQIAYRESLHNSIYNVKIKSVKEEPHLPTDLPKKNEDFVIS